jgi:integrase/recombinase XerD
LRHLEQQRAALQRFLVFLKGSGIPMDSSLAALDWPEPDPGASQVLSQTELQALLSGLRAAGPEYMDELLEQFYHHLGAERALASLTVESYAHDLQDFREFLRTRQREAWEEVSLEDFQHYLSFLQARGLSARSRARRLSALRQFFRFLQREERGARQPGGVAGLAPPAPEAAPGAGGGRKWRPCWPPRTPAPPRPTGQALLEVLYATGLRVSELVGLTLKQLDLRRGVVRPLGKGHRKSAWCPWWPGGGKAAATWMQGRPRLLQGPGLAPTSSSTGGAAGLTRQGFWKLLQAAMPSRPGGTLSPTPCAIPSPPTCCPGGPICGCCNASGPRRPGHHPDLHPPGRRAPESRAQEGPSPAMTKNQDPQAAPPRTLEVITTHLNADFDAMASMVAAKKLYPEAILVFPASQERNLRDFFIRSSFYFVDFTRHEARRPWKKSNASSWWTPARPPASASSPKPPRRRGGHPHLRPPPDSDEDVHGSLEVVEPLGSTTSILWRNYTGAGQLILSPPGSHHHGPGDF